MYTIEANSLSTAFQNAVDLIGKWAEDDPPMCWFRGVKDTTLNLRPGAYWRSSYNELEPLVSFVQEGVAFADVGTIEDWDTYYLAQHHGIPTRLLDWTDSFAAALFFAFDGWDGKSTPCVWILQPAVMNDVFLKWHGILGPERYLEMRSWLPKEICKANHIILQDDGGFSYDNRWPLAIYPKKTNHRISAQQGVFTIHGRYSKPLDLLISQAKGDPANALAKIELKEFSKDSVIHDLALLGIRRSSVYPDIDNFVLQLKEYYQW